VALNNHLSVMMDMDKSLVKCGCASMDTKLSDRNEGAILELGEDMGFASGDG
jgi:hypothetical protein